MERLIRILCIACAIGSLCCVTACSTRGRTQLCDGFQSYQTTQEVRHELGQFAVAGQWQEEIKGTSGTDTRPPYQILTMSGPFRLSGIDGKLKLTLFNDRLMSADFSTRNGQEYLGLLAQRDKVPGAPRRESKVDRRTKLRYDIDPDGTYRFSWTDPQLEDEWLKWVRNNS